MMTSSSACILERNDANRLSVEMFIAKRYRDCYGAHINHFPERLIALYDHNGALVAACGLRDYHEGFISAAYLGDNIAEVVSRALGYQGEPKDLIEFTSLAANTRENFIRILEVARDTARDMGKCLAIFTTTQLVSRILERQKVKTIFLAHADAAFAPGDGPWGDYYGPGTNVYLLPDHPDYAGQLFMHSNMGNR
ncbi:thermostable hemolysin [Alphaproteobacteria bacterium]|nr:thermostable hemolysin [Alphaproteobacteria bacterium]